MDFIPQTIQEIESASAKVSIEFSGVSAVDMDTKPDANSWSINECLDHIMQSNKSYFDTLDAIVAGEYRPNIWTKLPLLPSFWGKMIYGACSPDTQKKTKTFKVWLPVRSDYGRNLTQEFLVANQTFTGKLRGIKEKDLDTVIISSPAGAFITYSLRMGIKILTVHEVRHFNQAKRVKDNLARA